MSMCDICATPGEGTHLAASQIREAVFDRGFNPFALGLFPRPTSPGYYDHWKNTVVQHDVGDWNLCHRCMAAIRPYFSGEAAPLGILESQVPLTAAPPIPPPAPAFPREEARKAIEQTVDGRNRGYVPGQDPLVDAMVAPIVQELEKEKKKKGDDGSCLAIVLTAICSYGFHLVYQWGFWGSVGAGFLATCVLLGIGAFVWEGLSGKKKS